jgi:hypothetical protein
VDLDLTDAPLPVQNDNFEYETHWKKIIKLDCMYRPGVSELDFFGLFAKCEVCQFVIARQAFSFHRCVLQTEEGLEMTDVEE